MFKRTWGIAVFLILYLTGHSQNNVTSKLLIDSNACNDWNGPGNPNISNDGRFIFYFNKTKSPDSFYIRSSNNKWKAAYTDIVNPAFTQNNRYLLFQRHDSLFTLELGTGLVIFKDNVEGDVRILRCGTNNDFLIYKIKGNTAQLQILSIDNDHKSSIPTPENYWYDPSLGAIAFLVKENKSFNLSLLKYVLIKEGHIENIFSGNLIENLIFSSDGSVLAFTNHDSAGRKSIYSYRPSSSKFNKLTDNLVISPDSALDIGDIVRINSGNTRIFFTLIAKPQNFPGPGIDVWSYKDAMLQSQQLYELKNETGREYAAAVNISNGRVMIIEQKDRQIINFYPYLLSNNWVLLQQHGQGRQNDEWNWNKAALGSFGLLSLVDGSIRSIPTSPAPANFGTLSPDEKYVLYYEPAKEVYCSYEIETGIVRDLTNNIHANWTDLEMYDQPAEKYNVKWIAGFTDDGRFAFIYEQYDIFKIDLTGKIDPVNLTNGNGRSNHIVFRVANGLKTFSANQPIILEAFNSQNKESGFYSLIYGNHTTLTSLNMRPFSQIITSKARDANAYIVLVGDASSSPNFYFSGDLRSFTPLTNVYPERKYNWLTSELVTWQLPNGQSCQGILYKPENFDPLKKYPVIFHYYERMSDNLHTYFSPSLSRADIEIPHYVSNGYLVFTPDIPHYTIGHPGQSAFDCIVSGAKALCQRSYVDSNRMGLQGSSFGGFETVYVITHTNMFAAAMSSVGMTDFISAYGSIIGDGSSRQKAYELYRDRMGAPLSQIPDLYAENSPVLRANLVTTPLLMMTNMLDDNVPCQQGIELFTALRRLGKRSWMLQYDGEGHGLTGRENESDLTIRMFQFFNHYLKGEPPPKWMTVGIPAERKGIDNGLELDISGAKP